MATRRRFSREFKVEAVKLVKDRGVSVSQALQLPISFQCEVEAELHVNQSAHPAPHHGVPGCWIVGSRKIAAKLCDFPQITRQWKRFVRSLAVLYQMC